MRAKKTVWPWRWPRKSRDEQVDVRTYESTSEFLNSLMPPSNPNPNPAPGGSRDRDNRSPFRGLTEVGRPMMQAPGLARRFRCQAGG